VDACCGSCVCSDADRRPNLRDTLPPMMTSPRVRQGLAAECAMA
jgi:hypothetical protein